jgi:hypothetical protein
MLLMNRLAEPDSCYPAPTDRVHPGPYHRPERPMPTPARPHTPTTTDASRHDIGQSPRTLHTHPPLHRLFAVAAAFLALVLPASAVALLGLNAGRGAWDATVYHEPFVRQLAADFPRFDLSNPLTATTPGYHLLLAILSQIGLGSTLALRLITALFGGLLIAALAAWLTRRVRPLDALLLSLPLAASIYTFQASAFILPDNPAWLLVFLVIALCLRNPPGLGRLVLAAALTALLVFTRQVHLWAAGVVWLAAWLGVTRTDPGLFTHLPRRLPRTLLAFVITLPAVAIVAWFIHHWNGLTPPRFQGDMHGGNPATPAFILVQIVVLAIGFGPWLLPAVLRAARDHAAILLAAAALGLLIALIPATTTDPDVGRYSGWWAINAKAPVLFGRTSTLFLLLAPVGAMLIAGPLLALPHRARWTLLGALTAFTLAQSATFFSWQRYHEPFLILFLAMLAGLQPPELRATPFARLRLPAMAALCLVLAAISAQSLRGTPVAPGTPPPAKHTSPGDPWAQTQSVNQPERTTP